MCNGGFVSHGHLSNSPVLGMMSNTELSIHKPRGEGGGENGAGEGSRGDLSWKGLPYLPAIGCLGGDHVGQTLRLHFWLH